MSIAKIGRLLGFGGTSVSAAIIASPYVWTDENAVITLPKGAPANVEYDLQTITRAGWGPTKSGTATVAKGQLKIAPLTEGIHILSLKLEPPQTVRFLAMEPPSAIERETLSQTLPRSGEKLMEGEPFKILAMGDSITDTGDHATMLARMLSRATGNSRIACVNRSYPNCSIDASVRAWLDDGPPNAPDLGLLMYGLNDQITGVPLEAYLEQYEWIAQRLHELGADCVFLQPTPDIGIPFTTKQRKPTSQDPSFILRTLGWAEALKPLAHELKVPIAATFGAVWGAGGQSLEEAARGMWPMFPIEFNRQMESLLETEGRGDTIHLNALGHLQIAHAVFAALTGSDAGPAPPWNWEAHSEWRAAGVVSRIVGRNVASMRRRGRLEVAAPYEGQLSASPIAYDLAPGEAVSFEVAWPGAKQPEDLLTYSNDLYLASGRPMLPVVDYSEHMSHPYAVPAPFQPAASFIHQRQMVSGQTFEVTYRIEGQRYSMPVELPPATEVGRIPLLQKVEHDGKSGWIAGEVAFVRYGAARGGEADIDGDLSEWADALWVPVGEPVQARSWRGQKDNRITGECYLHWAFRAGRSGIHLACRAMGNIEKDTFLLFFDPRPPALLGTVGRYYWVGSTIKPDGVIALAPGTTSKAAPGLQGAWKPVAGGATLECFVPYTLMERQSWPESGDLGLSIVWTHAGATRRNTVLMWSENGNPWNPRWYGVVRRTDESNPQLPYMVRVR